MCSSIQIETDGGNDKSTFIIQYTDKKKLGSVGGIASTSKQKCNSL
jgi:hypothetical protein